MARFRVALVWSMFATGGRQVITAGLTFLLAAFLGPETYGIVAIASIFVHVIQMLLDQGLGTALVQREQLDDRHKNAAFWLTIALSLVLGGLAFGLADWWARVNNEPALGDVIRALALLIPLEGLTVVQMALLRREMDFKKLALRTNVAVLLGGSVGVSMAISGYGVWALVGQHLTTALSGVILLWAVSSWRPSLRFDAPSARDLIGFSTGALLGRIGVFINNRSDALLMGIFFGPVAVGLYRLSDRLMGLFVDLSARSIQAVALPEFSRFQSSPDRLATSVLRSMKVSASLAIPPLAVVAAGAEPLTGLLGERWHDAARPLQLLCIVGVVRSVTLTTGPVMRALGRPYAHALFMWGHALPSALVFWAVAVWLHDAPLVEQVSGIALSRAALFVLLFLPLNMAIVLTMVDVRPAALARGLWPACVAGLAGGAAVRLLEGPIAWLVPQSAVAAILTLGCGGGCAALMLLMTDADLRRMANDQWTKRFRGARSDGGPDSATSFEQGSRK